MKKYLVLFLLLFGQQARALPQSPCYWSGTYVKCLPTAGIAGVDGTVSLPSYSFSADPDTGMYRIGANDLGFAVNGAITLEATTTGIKSASVTWTDTTKGIVGTATNDSAGTGYVGEFIENNSSSANSVTTATVGDVEATPTGIVLTAGCWDINGVVYFSPAATTSVAAVTAWIGTATGTSTTGRDLNRNYAALGLATNVNGGTVISLTLPTFRVKITGSTTYYLKQVAIFTLSTMTVAGNLRATRVR